MILKYPGIVPLFDAENWSRSPCPEPMCVIYFHFTRERGSFFLAIITKFCHIQGSLGDRETKSVVFVETVIWSANFGCVPNVCFSKALHKYNRRLTICHWILCPLTIPDQTRWRSPNWNKKCINLFISTTLFLHKFSFELNTNILDYRVIGWN